MNIHKKTVMSDVVSPRLMQMKFMQRRQESDIREKLLEEKRMIDDALHWHVTYEEFNQSLNRIESIPSHNFLASTLLLGRQSYKNFNKPIEDAMQEKQKQFDCSFLEKTELVNDMSENELASRYEQFVGHTKRSFQRDQQSNLPNVLKETQSRTDGIMDSGREKKKFRGSTPVSQGSSIRGLLRK